MATEEMINADDLQQMHGNSNGTANEEYKANASKNVYERDEGNQTALNAGIETAQQITVKKFEEDAAQDETSIISKAVSGLAAG